MSRLENSESCQMSDLNNVRVVIGEGHPIISIAMASYDLLTGIKIPTSWDFLSLDESQPDLQTLFRALMINLPRHSELTSSDMQITDRVDFGGKNITSFCCSFAMTTTKTSYYSVSLFATTNRIPKSPYLNELVFRAMSDLAVRIRYSIAEGESLMLTMTPFVRHTGEYFVSMVGAGIPISPVPKSRNLMFECESLSSHFSTQMTTIIETDDGNEWTYIFDFLSNFLLPEQRKLSSRHVRKEPVVGLFLQCVAPQKAIPLEHLMEFDRPWTWIRTKDRKVYNFTHFDTQTRVVREYRSTVLLAMSSSSAEKTARVQRILQKYKPDPGVGTPWVMDLLRGLQRVKSEFACSYCQQKLDELVYRAVTMIEMMEHVIKKDRVGGKGMRCVPPDKKSQIGTQLRIADKWEMHMVCAIAQMFDTRSYWRLFSAKKDVINQMIVAV